MAERSPLKRRDITLYQQLDVILRDQISDGRLRPGDRLAPETDLCNQYGVSRATVRQALEALERDGLIERTAGRGTFLRGGNDVREPSRTRASWQQLIADDAARTGRVIRQGSAVPPDVVARELDLARDVEAPFLIRVLTDTKKQRAALKRYFQPDLAPVLTQRIREAPDLPQSLAKATRGRVRCKSFWVEAILAEPRFAMMLKVPLGSPLLSVWWVETLNGRAAICTQMLQPGPKLAVSVVA
jgi:GntR family transcriptional regulator